MTMPTADSAARPRLGRSIAAILAGFFTVFVLSIAADAVFHALGVYPPMNQPMPETGDNLLALGYRSVFTVLGSYFAARLAPARPMRHALILGGIGLIFATAGAIYTTTGPVDFGPDWFPILLAATTLPLAWLGGWLYGRGA